VLAPTVVSLSRVKLLQLPGQGPTEQRVIGGFGQSKTSLGQEAVATLDSGKVHLKLPESPRDTHNPAG
jgi:hypothetical protein